MKAQFQDNPKQHISKLNIIMVCILVLSIVMILGGVIAGIKWIHISGLILGLLTGLCLIARYARTVYHRKGLGTLLLLGMIVAEFLTVQYTIKSAKETMIPVYEFTSGQIVAIQKADVDGSYLITVQNEAGKERLYFVTNDTQISSELKEGCMDSCFSERNILNKVRFDPSTQKISLQTKDGSRVKGRKIEKMILTSEFEENCMTLSDGTTVNLEKSASSAMYSLENETKLLEVKVIDATNGGDKDIRPVVQHAISAYYQGEKPLFEVKEELELAYQDYLKMSSDPVPGPYRRIELNRYFSDVTSSQIDVTTEFRRTINFESNPQISVVTFDGQTGKVIRTTN